MTLSRYLAMLAALACAACAPIPHIVTTAPDIAGTLTSAGAPVAGQEVRVAWGRDDSPCDTTVVATRTTQDGKFELPRQTEFRFLYAPLVAPLSVRAFNVCAATPDKTLLLFRGIVPLYDARPLKLTCTLKELKPTRSLRMPPDEPCQAGS